MRYLLVATIFLTLIAAAIILLYLRDHRAYLSKVRSGGFIAQTACGPIEYIIEGEGLPVLALHGGGGGYDQGILLGQVLRGFQMIAPSRPGYLGTPIEVGRSHADQAEAMIALLDALDIDQTVVIAASAGGPVALQMALRHPHRVRGLVMISAISRSVDLSPRYERFIRLLLASDFIPWVLTTVNIDQAIRNNGPLPPTTQRDPLKMALLRESIRHSCTASQRYMGSMNDLVSTCKASFTYALDQIRVPTLVIHGDADPACPLPHGEHTARSIPDARLMIIEGGGHFAFVTHSEQVAPAAEAFIHDQFALNDAARFA